MNKRKLMPNGPTKPLSGYFKFCAEQRKKLSDEIKNLSVGDQAKKFSVLWSEVDDSDKERLNKEYLEKMKIYNEEMKVYKNTDEYKNAMEEIKKKKNKKEKTKVKKRPNAYNLFMKEEFEKMKENQQEVKFNEAIKEISGKWKGLDDEEKKKYKTMAEEFEVGEKEE
ncbi:HMG box protein [Spraguea lophii 42_110]|uniref:HMG box protein n=1 Tax=Spraguea lophii (strain 42_110) TaxID=1358809 RepID=S7XS84_SPRLO|nr:HMG box protein [Spraguea lophii 42_110]